MQFWLNYHTFSFAYYCLPYAIYSSLRNLVFYHRVTRTELERNFELYFNFLVYKDQIPFEVVIQLYSIEHLRMNKILEIDKARYVYLHIYIYMQIHVHAYML